MITRAASFRTALSFFGEAGETELSGWPLIRSDAPVFPLRHFCLTFSTVRQRCVILRLAVARLPHGMPAGTLRRRLRIHTRRGAEVAPV
jgi:hypothetical protein